MADDMGQPFAEIQGTGVLLVQTMLELENFLKDRGIEIEYKVQDDQEAFVWPSSGS